MVGIFMHGIIDFIQKKKSVKVDLSGAAALSIDGEALALGS